MKSLNAIFAVGALASINVAALAVGNVDVYQINGTEFIAGDGIPINGFTQSHAAGAGQQVSVALKARNRTGGQPNGVSGNRYFVDPGTVSSTPNLTIDYQFDPGTDATTKFLLRLSVDFDPAVGATDFAVIQAPIFDADSLPDATFDSWRDGDGFASNPGAAGWNDDTVPYVVANSWHLGYSFWTAAPFNKTYDPNAIGEYEIRLEAFSPDGSTLLASTTAFAVVPEPASLGLLGLAGMVLGRRRR